MSKTSANGSEASAKWRPALFFLKRSSNSFHEKRARYRPRFEKLETRNVMAANLEFFSEFKAALPDFVNQANGIVSQYSTMNVSHTSASLASALVDDAYEQNDTISTAYNLGTVSSPTTLNQLVQADSADWYRFSLTSSGTSTDSAAISFTHSQGDLDLQLYNSSGQLIRLSDSVTNREAVSLSSLAAGTYYIRVYGYRQATNPNYSLTINRAAPVTDDRFENNDTMATAANLGTLTAVQTTANLILADSQDWYRFAMNGAGTASDSVAISFQNSQGNLALEVYNSNGTRVAGANGSTNSETISLNGFAAGTYYVRVYGNAGALNPNYTLIIDPGVASTTPPPTNPPTTGTSQFKIEFTFSGLSTSQQAIFSQAASKWQSVIVGDLPNASYNGRVVDDLLIDASSVAIDGRGNVLGQAGPDRFRSGSQLPYHGTMQFDSADMAAMEANGTLLGVIMHEMGHVLGIGTLWSSKGLLVGAGTSSSRFVGAQATAEYAALIGRSANGVPLETGGGGGTRDAHWSESLFGSELMTGYVGPGSNMPLSRMTVASLADIGYTVNIASADSYALPGSSSANLVAASSSSVGGAQLLELQNSVLEQLRYATLAFAANSFNFAPISFPNTTHRMSNDWLHWPSAVNSLFARNNDWLELSELFA